MKRLRAILADDHALFRQGLKLLLEQESDVQVVAEVERASDLARVVAESEADLIVLDLQMERWSLGEIPSLATSLGVVVLTASERPEDALAALKLGARAVVHKRFAVDTLIDALRAAAEGLVWLPPSIQSVLASEWQAPRGSALTTREQEVVRQVALGFKNAEIAERLFISEVTVKTHINNIFQKLGLRDRVDLVRHAIRQGVVAANEQGR